MWRNNLHVNIPKFLFFFLVLLITELKAEPEFYRVYKYIKDQSLVNTVIRSRDLGLRHTSFRGKVSDLQIRKTTLPHINVTMQNDLR